MIFLSFPKHLAARLFGQDSDAVDGVMILL